MFNEITNAAFCLVQHLIYSGYCTATSKWASINDVMSEGEEGGSITMTKNDEG